MQKVQVYLVPNRITVTTDVTGSPTEYRKVYQQKLKLYKGIDNSIEFDVRNSDQRRQNIVGYSVIVKFFDQDHTNLFSVQGSPVLGKPGLMSVTVSADDIERISPQLLKMAAYLRNDQEEIMLYADSQFDLFGTVELLDGYNEKNGIGDVIDVIKVFNYEFDSVLRTSEVGSFGNRLNDDYSTLNNSVTVDIYLTEDDPYVGDITVQLTKDKSTASSVFWELGGTVTIPEGAVSPVSVPIDTDSDEKYRFMRFQYKQGGLGGSASFDVTRADGIYSVTLKNGGSGYSIGDRILIKGSRLDGVDGINDIIITVTAVDTFNSIYRRTIATFNYSGTAVAGNGTYSNLPSVSSFGSIDKIVIRN